MKQNSSKPLKNSSQPWSQSLKPIQNISLKTSWPASLSQNVSSASVCHGRIRTEMFKSTAATASSSTQQSALTKADFASTQPLTNPSWSSLVLNKSSRMSWLACQSVVVKVVQTLTLKEKRMRKWCVSAKASWPSCKNTSDLRWMFLLVISVLGAVKLATCTANTNASANLMQVSWLVNLLASAVPSSVQKRLATAWSTSLTTCWLPMASPSRTRLSSSQVLVTLPNSPYKRPLNWVQKLSLYRIQTVMSSTKPVLTLISW